MKYVLRYLPFCIGIFLGTILGKTLAKKIKTNKEKYEIVNQDPTHDNPPIPNDTIVAVIYK